MTVRYARPTQRGTAYPYNTQGSALAYAPAVGAATTTPLDWAKENKWYLIGGGLLVAAGVAYAVSQH